MSTNLSGQILLKTLWSQDSDGELVFNTYCPVDPVTAERSVVGCAALMHAQILYYWVDQGADLSLTLTSADAYRTSTRHIYISGEENPAYDYGVFSDINEQLAEISADTTDDIAALCYACGVLIESDYTSSATSASMTSDVYVRAGFDSFNFVSSSSNSLFYTTVSSRFSSQTTISDAGWEVVQDNLLNGLVIAVASSTLSHALVMDGYNAEAGTYHLNFGWGSDNGKEYSSAYGCSTGTGWYTEDELDSLSIYSLGIDLYPVYDGAVLTVTDSREYGVGTLYRIIEQASGIQEKVTIDVSADLADASISLSTALPSVSHDLVIKNLYGDIRIQTASSGMSGGSGTAEASLSSDTTLEIENFAAEFAAINASSSAIAVKAGTNLVIDKLTGVAAANTLSTSYALYSGGSSDISLVNGGLFAGKYTVSASSGESAITNIFTAFENFGTEGVSAFSGIESCATGYAVYSGDGDDYLSLTDDSAILGCVYLAGGENSITVESGSYLHSYIMASADTLNLTFDLNEYSSTALISLVDLTVSSFHGSTIYYGIDALTSALADTITVDVSDAEAGTYTLLSGAEEDSCSDLIFDLGNDIQLSLAGVQEYGAYTLAWIDDSLTLSIDSTENAASITIKANSASKMYDGSALTDAGYTFTQGILADGDELVVTVEGSITDAGTAVNKITEYAIMRDGEDVTSLYSFSDTVDGELTVTKRNVVLTSATVSKFYDGTALTDSTITVSGDGFVEGEGATYDVTGTQTDVGSSANTFTYTLDENTNANNYNISTEEGVLTVNAIQAMPPDKPDGGGEGGGSEDTTTLTGVLQLDSGTKVYDGEEEGETLSSTTSDENVVLAQNGATLTISNYTLNKTGDCSNADNSNFYAVNAVVAAKSAAKIYIDNSALNSDAEGANGLFASGEGSTIYAYNCTITSTGNSSRGLDATYEGTVIASKLTINTSGDHCAALATDRGDGYISVTNSTLTTAGQGSPLIYSTGIIEVDNVTGTSTGSQVAGIEGLSTIRIKNSNLSGSGKKASEPVANGVIIYQSMSGDSTEGTATFEVADSTLKSAINGGAMFYITNTEAVITVQNTTLDFDSDSNYLLKAAGNDGSNGWGTAGANGADVIFTAIDQTLSGTVSVDGISSLDMYLINSAYTGTFELDTTYTGDGGSDLYIDANSTWTVTGSCTLQSLTVAAGAKILDSDGKTVSIVKSGKTVVSGTSDLTITVSAYTSATVEALYTINDFEIDRSAFEEMYAEEEPETDYDDRIVVADTSSYTLQAGKTYTAAPYEGNGGAVYSSGTVTGKNVTFKDNSVTASDGQGGAIYNGSDAVLNLTGAAFTGNNTTGLKGQGGAIYNGGTATVTNGTISSNSATMGGAIFNNGGSLELTGATISGNSAKYGGAIQNFKGGTVNITDTEFSGNSAAADGGAIAHNSGSMTITGATFSTNTARSSGGAIWNASTLTLADVTFSGNSAKTSGGAICNTGTLNMTGTVTLTTESDDIYNTGTLNWDLTGGIASYGSIAGYQYLNNDDGTLTITVDDKLETGSYTIATGDLSDLDGKNTFTLTGMEGQSNITINGESVLYNDMKYTLATSDNGTAEDQTDDKLVLTVTSPTSPSIADATITVTGKYTYNGEAQEAAVTVKLDGTTLVKDIDYTLAYTNNVNAGIATVTVTGINDYAGTKTQTFTIAQKELTVTGTTADGKTYDGNTEAVIGTSGILSGVVGSDNVSIDSVTGEFADKNAGNGKDVTIKYTLSGDQASNYTVSDSITTADISKRNVTLTSATDSKVYDGTALTNSTITVSGDGFVEGEGATYDVTGTQTDVGSSANTFTYSLNDGTTAGNYNITTKEGLLSVTSGVSITITANSASKMYDGSALTDTGYTFTQGILADGDELVVTVDGSITDAGTATNKVTGYKVMRGTQDVTFLYNFTDTVDGVLTVTKRDVTLTSGSASKDFDGLPLTCDTVTVSGSGFADDEGATYDVTGSQTDIGSSANTFTYTLNGNTKADNYSIAVQNGTLTVSDMSKDSFDRAIIRSDFGYQGVLYVVPSEGNSLTSYDIELIMANGNVSNVQFLQQDLSGINKLTFNTASAISIGFRNGAGTAKNDTIRFKKGTEVVFGTAGCEIDLADGSNTVQIDDNAEISILAGLSNVSTVKTGNISTVAAADIKGAAKATSITIGKESVFSAGSITLNDAADKITIGSDSTFTADAVDFGSGTDSMTIGSRSTAEISGDLKRVNKLTLSNGSCDWTKLTADAVTGTEKNDNFNFGNYSDVDLKSGVSFDIGNDTLKIGSNSKFTTASLDFGDGNDKLSVGKSSAFAASAVNGADTISLGACSTMQVGDIANTKKLTISNGKEGQIATLKASAVTGTDANDSYNLGNWNDVDFASLDFGDGNDTLKIGSYADVDIDSLDFGEGIKDKLTIGKGATLSVNTLDVDSLDSLSMSKDAILYLGSASYDAAMETEWGKKYSDQISKLA